MSKAELKRLMEDEMKNFTEVTVKDLVCRTCDYSYNESKYVSICERYPYGKPGYVLYGKECPKHS
jgi:hypothetical protein